MKLFGIATFAVAAILLSACGGNSGNTTTDGGNTATNSSTTTTANTSTANTGAYTTALDLSKELGTAIKIKVPADFKSTSSKGIIQEVSIEGTDYFVQIMGMDALSTDRKALKNEAIAEAKAMKEFSTIVQEDDFGFVYETNWDAGSKGYNFRYFVVANNRTFDFRTNSVNNFNKAQVQAMYAAVKQE
jgi:hypothetical protein